MDATRVKQCWVIDESGVYELMANMDLTGGADVLTFTHEGETRVYPAVVIIWDRATAVRRCLEMRDKWNALATRTARAKVLKV